MFLFLTRSLRSASGRLAACIGTGLLCLFISGPALAVDAQHTQALITLDQAIKKTLHKNPQLYEFHLREQALTAQSKTAQLKPAYHIEAEVENLFGTGDLSGSQQAELSLSLSSVIELGDKVQARSQYASVKQQQLSVQKQLQSLDVLGEVTRRYINVLAQQQALAVLQDAEQLAHTTLQAVRQRVNAGASPLFEQKRAQAALAEATMTLATAKQKLQSQKNSLAILWGDDSANFNSVSGDLFSLTPSPNLSSLVKHLKSSPHIQLYAEQTQLEAAQLRVTQAASRADIRWSAGVSHANDSQDTAFIAGVSIPLFSQHRNRGSYEAQRAKLGQVEQQKKARLRYLYHQLNQTLDARERAAIKVKRLQEDIITPLEEALVLVEKAYRNGRFSYLEWVSTRQELVDARYELVQAAEQVHLRGADLEALTGTALSFFNTHSQHQSTQSTTIFSEIPQ